MRPVSFVFALLRSECAQLAGYDAAVVLAHDFRCSSISVSFGKQEESGSCRKTKDSGGS